MQKEQIGASVIMITPLFQAPVTPRQKTVQLLPLQPAHQSVAQVLWLWMNFGGVWANRNKVVKLCQAFRPPNAQPRITISLPPPKGAKKDMSTRGWAGEYKSAQTVRVQSLVRHAGHISGYKRCPVVAQQPLRRYILFCLMRCQTPRRLRLHIPPPQ